MQTKTFAPGQQAWFFRNGDAITIPAAGGSVAGPASISNKPNPLDPNYIPLGSINDWEDDLKGTDVEIWGPAPGRQQLIGLHETKVKSSRKFTAQQMSAIAAELFYRPLTLLTPASAQFNSLTGTKREGWLHVQRYDNDNNLWMTEDTWGVLRVTGGIKSKEGAIIEPTFEQIVYYSLLNSSGINE
jgi:hypothetical protein